MDLKLTENALTVLESRYLWDLPSGKRESPKDLFKRVARAVASVEKSGAEAKWRRRFEEILFDLRFLPNSPTLMNAGKPDGQLSACFVLPVGDSLPEIFDALKSAALIHQSGGGTGFSFSRLRPGGVTSGPVSFMRVFDLTTQVIKQGGTRRGANMAILRVDHPDILEFIGCKRDQKSILNFNISVGMTDAFLRALANSESYSLIDPRDGRVVKELNAQKVWYELTQVAWECGDPGLVFLDRIAQFNPTPQVGAMESTNPCGEQPLLPHESCNLGSLNLVKYASRNSWDAKRFAKDVHTAVRFLDNVIELNVFPVPESREITRRNRKVGLGVMGFADLLLHAGIPYGSSEARAWGEQIMSTLDREAKAASAQLAVERGAFANWKSSLWQRLGYPKMRNATVSTVAPTGTISMIAGCSSGIEPIFAAVFARNVLDGKRLVDFHPAVRDVLKAKGRGDLIDHPERITEQALREAMGAAWSPAASLSIEEHIRMQAVFQRFSDSAVSKTINLPHSATREDVAHAYLLAAKVGCKGITVYRDQSRRAQVLDRMTSNEEVCVDC